MKAKKIYNANLNQTIELKPDNVDEQTERKTISDLEKHFSQYNEDWNILREKISEVINYLEAS